jgi:hypothetical protein
MSQQIEQPRTVFALEGLMNLFLRIVAIALIGFAIRYWLLLIGILDPAVRFDTMESHWKVAATFFSVFYPIAALGLWGLFRWGIVIWFFAASFELVMHLVYPQLFGDYYSLVVFHVTSLACWLLCILIEYLDRQRLRLKEQKQG